MLNIFETVCVTVKEKARKQNCLSLLEIEMAQSYGLITAALKFEISFRFTLMSINFSKDGGNGQRPQSNKNLHNKDT